MDRANWSAEFFGIVEKNKQNLYEICKACMVRMIEDSDTAQEGFQYFLTQIPLPRYNQNEVPEELFDVVEDEVDSDTQNRLDKMEYQIVKELIFQDVSEDIFYKEIWKRLSDTLLVSDNYQRAYFLYRLWMDLRIPYYQLGLGTIMDSETYNQCVKRVEIPYKMMLFAMSAGYPKKTQKASILMKIADEIPSREERIVFWSLTLGRLEQQIIKLKKRIEELESLIEFYDDMETE